MWQRVEAREGGEKHKVHLHLRRRSRGNRPDQKQAEQERRRSRPRSSFFLSLLSLNPDQHGRKPSILGPHSHLPLHQSLSLSL